ncbi:BRCA1-A complex subunit RAP80 [Petromyzon marinus]|uniref:BRCA1-A complex subunit RAP80 n=1 Tax=Petromyzon marinus TaxID=7757 RepID=UPI003F72C2E4
MSKITVEIIDSNQSSVDDEDSGPSGRLDGKQREAAANRPGARTAQTRGTREQRAQQRDFIKCVTDMSEDEQVVLAMKISCEEREERQTQDKSTDLKTSEVSSSDGSPPRVLGSVSSRSTTGRAQTWTTRQHRSPASGTASATDSGGSRDSKLNTDASQQSSDSHGADDEDSIKSDRARKPRTHISLKRKNTQSSSVINKKAKVLPALGEEHPIEFATQSKDRNDDVGVDDEPRTRSIRDRPIVFDAGGLRHDIGTGENGPGQVERNNCLISGGAKATEGGALPCGPSGRTLGRDDVVNYYWGVPFCPAGLNPDEYTSVILCQLQTYAAVAKQQQRRLLRKADMCEALPEPARDRRWRGRSEARAGDAKRQPFAAGEESGAAGEEKQGVSVQGGRSTPREWWEEKEGSDNVNEDEGLSKDEDEGENEDSESSAEKVREKSTDSLRASTMSPPDEKVKRLPKCKLQRRKGLPQHKDVKYSDTPKLGEIEYGKICDDDEDDDFISLPTLKRVSGTPQRRADEVVFLEDNCTAGERGRTARRDSSAFSTGSPYLAKNTRSDNCSKNEMMLSTGSLQPRKLTLANFSAVDGKIQTPTRVRKESDGKMTEHIGEKVDVKHRANNSKVTSPKINEHEFDLILDDDDDNNDDDKQTNQHDCTRKTATGDCKEYKNQSGDSNDVIKVRDIEGKLTTSPSANDGTIVTNKAKLKVMQCEEEGVMERYEETPEPSLQSSDGSDRKHVLSLQKHNLQRKNEQKERLEKTVPCPLCLVEFLASHIEQHASECCISEDVDDAENYVPSNSKMEVPSWSREGSTGASRQTFVPESDSNSSTSLVSEREVADGSDNILEGIVISNSPIKSFRSISQSPDCLIDFKNQFNKPARPRTGFRKHKPGRRR